MKKVTLTADLIPTIASKDIKSDAIVAYIINDNVCKDIYILKHIMLPSGYHYTFMGVISPNSSNGMYLSHTEAIEHKLTQERKLMVFDNEAELLAQVKTLFNL